MCGIIFVSSKEGRSAMKPMLRRWRKQTSRGSEGFGFVSVDEKGKISQVCRATRGHEIETMLKQTGDKHILFHHRQPTSLPNYVEATHPLVVQWEKLDHDYYIVHNGVISNWETTFEKYKKDGYAFKSEMKESKIEDFVNVKSFYETDPEIKVNDSECFAIDLAMYLDGKSDAIESVGSIAFIALKADKQGNVLQLIWGHNDRNPLTLEDDKTLFSLRSIGGTAVDTDKIYFKDWKTNEVTMQVAKVGFPFLADKYPKNSHKTDMMGYGLTNKADDKDFERYLHPEHPLLPANVPARDGLVPTPVPRSIWAGKDDERESKGIIESKAEFDQDVIDYGAPDDEPTIETVFGDDPKFPKELMKEIHGMIEDKQADTDIVKSLRESLRSSIYNLYEAKGEYDAAILLLKEAKNGKYDTREADGAWAMMAAARQDFTESAKAVHADAAELSAWINGDKF